MKTDSNRLCRREFLTKASQVTLAAAALGSAPLPMLAGTETSPARAHRISYYMNGEIHVNDVGGPEGKPLISPPVRGQEDFKPSWSKTNDMLVCFRRLKDDPVTVNWKTAIFIINADGTGFHQLTDGTYTDFNPTWTRDGLNTPIWNRKNDKKGGFIVMQGKVGGQPGEEVALTDASFHNWGHSCLMDGRIVVTANPPKQGGGIFLLTRREGPKPIYERVQCELTGKGIFHRMSVSPNEKKICFEYITFERQKLLKSGEPGHTLYIADFDAQQRTITNLKAFANAEEKPIWFAYARWIDGESAVVYHSTQTGKGQLYVYRLEDGSTKRVSTNPKADYRYPHGEAAPC
jgi:Tol biopolymer transport system component